jgi:hypothetical protein
MRSSSRKSSPLCAGLSARSAASRARATLAAARMTVSGRTSGSASSGRWMRAQTSTRRWRRRRTLRRRGPRTRRCEGGDEEAQAHGLEHEELGEGGLQGGESVVLAVGVGRGRTRRGSLQAVACRGRDRRGCWRRRGPRARTPAGSRRRGRRGCPGGSCAGRGSRGSRTASSRRGRRAGPSGPRWRRPRARPGARRGRCCGGAVGRHRQDVGDGGCDGEVHGVGSGLSTRPRRQGRANFVAE